MKDNRKSEPNPNSQHQYYGNEIDIIDIVKVLWNQRWFILIFTLLFTGLTAGYILVRSPLYEISAQISPGITDFDRNGNAIRKLSPENIVAWFTERGYAESLGVNEFGTLPEIEARIISKSNNVNVSYYSEDLQIGIATLDLILKNLNDGRADYFKRELNVGRATLDQKIREIEQANKSLALEKNILQKIDKVRITNQIDALQEKLAILNKKIEIIEMRRMNAEKALDIAKTNLQRMNKNTEDIIALRKKMITEGADKVTLLLYSNILQQNISYANTIQRNILELNNEINEYKEIEKDRLVEVYELKAQIQDYTLERDQALSLKEKDIQIQIENGIIEIDTLKMKMKNLSIIDIIKQPQRSWDSKFYDNLIIVIASVFIGLLLSVFISFIRSFWKHNKAKIVAT